MFCGTAHVSSSSFQPDPCCSGGTFRSGQPAPSRSQNRASRGGDSGNARSPSLTARASAPAFIGSARSGLSGSTTISAGFMCARCEARSLISGTQRTAYIVLSIASAKFDRAAPRRETTAIFSLCGAVPCT